MRPLILAGVVVVEHATGVNIAWLITTLIVIVVEIASRLIPTRKRGSMVHRILASIQHALDAVVRDRRK